MATIIDALVVTLGLDNSDFNKKRAQVKDSLKDTANEAEKSGKRTQQSLDKSTKSFDQVAKSAAKFLAVIASAAAIKGFIERQIEANSALDRFSQNLNESVSNISAWSNAAEQAGGTAEGLQGTMDMLSKSQTDLMLTGQSGLIPYFSALGVSMTDAEGKARPVSDILLDLSDRFSKMPRTTANNMGRMMGIDQGTMYLLLKGRTEVETLIARQKEYAAVTKQQAEQASRLRLLIVESTQNFRAFGRELLSNATPAIEKVFQIMSDFGAWCMEHKEFISTFLLTITTLLIGLGLAVTPINLTVVAITALAAAIAGLWDDYQVWKEGGDSLIDWSKWEPGIEMAKKGVRGLVKILEDAFYRMFALIDAGKKAWEGDWQGMRFALGEVIAGNENGSGIPSMRPPAAGTAGTVNGKPTAAPGNAASKMSALEKKYGLPAGLLDNVWKTESGRGRNMKSSAGAEGHFQFMTATAKQYGLSNPYDFDESADAAARYYRDLLKANGGDLRLAAAAYNWGQGNLNRKGISNAPNETIGYMAKITAGIKGASGAARVAGAGNMAAGANTYNNGGSNHVETHIGEVKVITQATDANGIAKDMGNSLEYLFASQANYGPT